MAIITNASQAALNQAAANIAQTVIVGITQGAASRTLILDLAYAVLALVQYNANNSTATINLPNYYATNVPLTNVTISPPPR